MEGLSCSLAINGSAVIFFINFIYSENKPPPSARSRSNHWLSFAKQVLVLTKKTLPGLNWLGWKDSNLRMPGPKPGALPLGDIPILGTCIMILHKYFMSIKSRYHKYRLFSFPLIKILLRTAVITFHY